VSVIVFEIVVVHFAGFVSETVARKHVFVKRMTSDVSEHGRNVVVVERLAGRHARAQRRYHLLAARVLQGRGGDGQKARETEERLDIFRHVSPIDKPVLNAVKVHSHQFLIVFVGERIERADLFKNRSLPRAFRIGDDDVEERSVDASIISESDDRSKRRSRHLEQQGTENATFQS